MKLVIVAVKDRMANVYSQPSFVTSLGIAIRSFQDQVNKAEPSNVLYDHADDFDLYQLGEYDDNTGQFTNLEAPKQIAVGANLKK